MSTESPPPPSDELPPQADLMLPPPLPPEPPAPPSAIVSEATLGRSLESGMNASATGPESAGRYYLLVQGQRRGPLAKTELLRHGLDHQTLVWFPGASRWRPARDIPDLDEVLQWVPPPPPGAYQEGALAYECPRPSVFPSLFWWMFSLAMTALFFAVLTIVFFVLYENLRRWDFRGWPMRNPLWFALAIISLVVGSIFLIASSIVYAVLVHRMWSTIQDGYTQTSPSLAAGLLFVPLINFFWFFIAIYGFARESNAYLMRHGLNARRAPAGLALANCICLIVPWVNLVAIFTLSIVTMAMLKNTAMDIAALREQEREEGGLGA